MRGTPPLRPIAELAAELGLGGQDVIAWGRHAAKVKLEALVGAPREAGRLVLVSAITPTPAGEGKTTVSVGLAMGLRRLGHRAIVCLREPSLGPVFGMKGGGTGGGRAQVVPAEDINLHFTGDIHAVTTAHNLLAALVDNELYFGSAGGLSAQGVTWPRVMDMNDRALRRVMVMLDEKRVEPRRTRFDITAASEVMAVLTLASDAEDLRQRLGRIVVGWTKDGGPVTASDLEAADAMAVLLRDALLPNLVQTAEGGPAFVHGGPFANIAHGCSSVLATRAGLGLGDIVVTEAGFGMDLGGEKFLDLKCRAAGIWPRAVVLVASLRALATHGGAGPDAEGGSDLAALGRGLRHLDRQVANVRAFGLEAVIALNVFGTDREEGLALVERACAERGLGFGRVTAFAEGGRGGEALGRAVLGVLERTDAAPPTPRFLYALQDSYADKLHAVATLVYGAVGVDLSPKAAEDLARFEAAGFGGLPVCIAKTHLSLSDDPKGGGDPRGFRARVREVRLSAGAGFVVALMGPILTMPGLPREPSAKRVRIGEDGRPLRLMQGE